MHPNRGSVLVVRYSPDGERVVACDSPGRVIQVWDAATGRQLTRIDAGRGYRAVSLSPDGKTVYVPREESKMTPFEKDGKKMVRLEMDGDVRAWDLDTGELRATFQHTPPRGILILTLAPDGSTFTTGEELAGEWERGKEQQKFTASLWDVKTGQFRPLPVHPGGAAYSPDGRTIAGTAYDDDGFATAVKLFDVGTAEETRSIPIAEEGVRAGGLTFSPDGKLLVGRVVRVRPQQPHALQVWLKFWDVAAGREVASFSREVGTGLSGLTFSPDGKVLAAAIAHIANWRGKPAELLLFDVPGRKLAKTLILGEKPGEDERSIVRDFAFSPQGEWLAVITQAIPELPGNEELSAEETPQPRVHLIDVAGGEVRETLVMPPSFPRSMCFSPDGKTLATGGNGKVLLWDLTEPPGTSPDEP